MRAAHSTLLLSFVTALGTTFFASQANADTSTTTPSCGDTGKCSAGSASSLHAESREPVMSSVGTGWLPACDTPDAQGHCGSDQPIQVSVSMDLAALPTPSTEPLWMVDMARNAIVDAAWPSTSKFDLSLRTATTNDGTLKVTHTLIPSIRVYGNLFGISATWTYDASKYLIDNAANFHYLATNSVNFAPWAFTTPAINLVPAPSLTTTELVNVKLVNDANNDVDLGLSATTSPTFTYQTTKVTFAGSTNPITQDAKTGSLPMVDSDFLVLEADVEGLITVTGTLTAAPYVAINKIGGFSIPGGLGVLDLTNLLDAPQIQYTATPAVSVKFPHTQIRVPLPNVKVPKSADLGKAQVGDKTEGKVTIKNTGEMGAKMTFLSSDPQFEVIGSAVTDAKKDYDLNIRFTPKEEGQATATITVSSNDPDAPTQTLQVTAMGAPIPAAPPPATDDTPPDTSDDAAPVDDFSRAQNGCGCRTTPSSSSTSGGLALALGALLFVRRRRSS